MGHRKWVKARSWREFHADDMIAEHNVLYDAWSVERDRAGDLLKDRNAIQGKLDEARKRIAELESPIRVPFSDDQIKRMARAAYTARMRREEKSRCWDEIPLMSKDAWRQGIRAALAAGGLEPCAVTEYDPDDVALRPSDDEVEKLARVLRGEHAKVMGADALSYGLTVFCAYARAAIAHLDKRPEGLPTAEELLRVYAKNHKSIGGMQSVLAALRPWLRDPVGCDLDVTADVIEVIARSSSRQTRAKEIIDLCRKRIKPVYECKECAGMRDEVTFWKRENVASNNKMLAARAALEGE